MSDFDEIRKEIKRTLPKSPVKSDPKHAELVLKWVLKLRPDADEALKIAALSHDIDRATSGMTDGAFKGKVGSEEYERFKKEHSVRSARFICDLLKKYKYPDSIIKKVKHLVENHESGGDEESDILRDADSLAYLEYNIPEYLKNHGRERTINKIRHMHDRMSAEAKRLEKTIRLQGELKELLQEAIF
jgi:hypothetical protein